MDCAGVCGGDAEEDECGICGGDNAACTDCNGVINGDAVYDNCGYLCIVNTPLDDCSVYCDNDISNDCAQDCAGMWGGSIVNDDCGICGGDNSTCKDCEGVPNGDAVYDNCGIVCLEEFSCSNGTSINETDCTDAGATWAQTNTSSDCSIYCDDDSSNDCTQDCAGTWGGNYVDDACGTCNGTITDSALCVCPGGEDMDCAGLCSDAILYGLVMDDSCGICGGDNSTCVDCAGTPYGLAVEDNCDTCDTNSSNDCTQDCTGNWCIEGSVGCLVGVGNICTVSNHPGCDACDVCTGLDNYVSGTCNDCAGIPGGDSVYDICGLLCLANTSLDDCSVYCDDDSENDCAQDCEGIWGGTAVEDECGDCNGGGPEEYYDCNGNCTEDLDCEFTCGGTVAPDFVCPDGSLVCDTNGCDLLDIQPHLLPDKFGINKIFPNPFNPITQIQYEISGYAFVKVRIFDIRGRKVAQLMNEYQNPGQYHINWDAGNHASGMYIVEMVIRSGDNASIFRDVRKILYMK